MPAAEDITLGEVYRGLQQLRTESSNQFAALNRVMGERLVGRELYHVAHEALQKEVTELELRIATQEASRRAIWLTLMGSIIAGAASYLSIVFGPLPHH